MTEQPKDAIDLDSKNAPGGPTFYAEQFGGPAFPSGKIDALRNEVSSPVYYGMSLRDYFAAAALTGILAAHAHPNSAGPAKDAPEVHADSAYRLADALLAQRSKP